VVGFAVVLLAGAVAAVVLTGQPGPPTGLAYRIVYRVTTYPGGVIDTTQVLEAHRPFLASLITRAGPPPGAGIQSGSVVDGGFYLVESVAGRPVAQLLGGDVADPQSTDLRLQPALSVAASLGMVGTAGSDQILGMPCTRYLSDNPLDGGDWKPATATDRVVSCVSAAGFLLQEDWTISGKPVRTRVAVSFTRKVPGSFAPLLGLVRKSAPVELALATAVPLGPTAQAPLFVRVPVPPPGMSLVRALRVTEFTAGSPLPTPVAEDRRLVYTNGNDIITLTERDLLSPNAASLSSGGEPVPLGALGTGRLVPGPAGLRVVVDMGGNRELDIVGTGGEPALLGWIRSLRAA